MFTDWVTYVGAFSALIGVVYAGQQLRHASKTSEGTFLLELSKQFDQHRGTINKLRPTGIWGSGASSPISIEDWSELEDCMAFYEHCEVLIRNRSLNPQNFRDLFGFGLENLLENKLLVSRKLDQERQYWTLFSSLVRRMGLKRKLPKLASSQVDLAATSNSIGRDIRQESQTVTAWARQVLGDLDEQRIRELQLDCKGILAGLKILSKSWWAESHVEELRGLVDTAQASSIFRKALERPELLQTQAAALSPEKIKEQTEEMKRILPTTETLKVRWNADATLQTAACLIRDFGIQPQRTAEFRDQVKDVYGWLSEGECKTQILEEIASSLLTPGSRDRDWAVSVSRRLVGQGFLTWYRQATGRDFNADEQEIAEQERRDRSRREFEHLMSRITNDPGSGDPMMLMFAFMMMLGQGGNSGGGAAAPEIMRELLSSPNWQKTMMHWRKR